MGERIAGALDGQRQAVAFPGGEDGTHLGEGGDDSGHGAAAQRGIAGEEGGQPVGRHHPHEETGAGAGIAEVEHIGGLAEAPDAAPDHPPDALLVAPGLGPQRPHGRGAAQHILALEQAVDLALAHRESAHHEGAVGDRFVARHAGGSGERAGGSGHEWLQDGGTPCRPLGRPWPARRASLDSLRPGRVSGAPERASRITF